MLGLTSLEVYNSVFYITEEKNIIEFYTDTFDEFSFDKVKDELEEVLSFSDTTPSHLQHEILGPRNIETYKNLRLENTSTDCYYMLIMGNARSPCGDFECYLRIVVALEENEIQLTLNQYKSFFFADEVSPDIYTIEDISKAVYTMGDHNGTLWIEYGDTGMKTKIVLIRFGGTFGTLRFDEKSFF